MILRERLLAAGGLEGLFLSDHRSKKDLAGIVSGERDAAATAALAGRRVLLAVGGQMAAARAMIALDGLAARLALVPRSSRRSTSPGSHRIPRRRSASPMPRGCLPTRCRACPASTRPTFSARAARHRGRRSGHWPPPAPPARRSSSPTPSKASLAVSTRLRRRSPARCGAPSTTSAATAASKCSCGRCSGRPRSCSPTRASRCATISSASARRASPTSSARPRTGASP